MRIPVMVVCRCCRPRTIPHREDCPSGEMWLHLLHYPLDRCDLVPLSIRPHNHRGLLLLHTGVALDFPPVQAKETPMMKMGSVSPPLPVCSQMILILQ